MSATDTKLQLRAAMEARDRRAVVEAFAEDAILRSPFTSKLVFEGREQLDGLIAVILDVLENLRYTDELHGHGSAVLIGEAQVRGLEIQFTDYLKLNAEGLVQEMTVFFRPLPATTAAMRQIGAGLARQRSKQHGLIVGAMVAPLAAMTRAGDKLGVRLVKPD